MNKNNKYLTLWGFCLPFNEASRPVAGVSDYGREFGHRYVECVRPGAIGPNALSAPHAVFNCNHRRDWTIEGADLMFWANAIGLYMRARLPMSSSITRDLLGLRHSWNGLSVQFDRSTATVDTDSGGRVQVLHRIEYVSGVALLLKDTMPAYRSTFVTLDHREIIEHQGRAMRQYAGALRLSRAQLAAEFPRQSPRVERLLRKRIERGSDAFRAEHYALGWVPETPRQSDDW